MIDTLRLSTPLVIPAGFDDERWAPRHVTRIGQYIERYQLRTDRSDPPLPHVRIIRNSTRGELIVETSLPRVNPLDDGAVADAIGSLNDVAARGLANNRARSPPPVPSLWEWTVGRVDVFFNYKPKAAPYATAREALFSLRAEGRTVKHMIALPSGITVPGYAPEPLPHEQRCWRS